MNQKNFTFDVTLDQDVIVSASSATVGQHISLDYIPGGALLGMVAAKLYRSLTADEAWTVFHSGQVRFSDAMPLAADNGTAWPVPLSLHSYKGEKFTTKQAACERLTENRLFNLVMKPELDSRRQPKQLRGGYVSESGEYIRPAFNQHMKTAINAETGKAAHSQLFGYQSLAAGQSYSFTLVVDNDVDSKLVEGICSALCGQAVIGRSRSAQYGGVTIFPSADSGRTGPAGKAGEAEGLLVLWLLSDLALVDESGCPTLQPNAALLGLPAKAEWLPARSFMRSRSYSPYNAWRRCYDPERQVISRGSVLIFNLPVDVSELPQQLWRGLYQEAGLGQMMMNPALLSGNHPKFTKLFSFTGDSQASPAKPQSDLIRLLDRITGNQEGGNEAQNAAESIFTALLQKLFEARSWLAISQAEPLQAPARSQWGQIKSLANDYRQQPQALWNALFEGDKALVRKREGQPGWMLETGPCTTLRDGFTDALGLYRKNPLFADIAGRLAVLAMASRWQDSVEGKQTLGVDLEGEGK